jgi:hypothetical protein
MESALSFAQPQDAQPVCHLVETFVGSFKTSVGAPANEALIDKLAKMNSRIAVVNVMQPRGDLLRRQRRGQQRVELALNCTEATTPTETVVWKTDDRTSLVRPVALT